MWRTHYWSFDYFSCNAVERSLRERSTAYLILAPIFSEPLTTSAVQKKSAQFSQKSRYLGACHKIKSPCNPSFHLARRNRAR